MGINLFKITIQCLVISVVAFSFVAATPKQPERPPQPFFQDFFSGSVSVQGNPPPDGTQLIACIDGCETGFQSNPYYLHADGTFDQLEVDPGDEGLVGHLITFHLVNEHGMIKALESRPYVGVFDFYVQNLTFVEGMPVSVPTPTPKPKHPTPMPTPRAALPVAGDPDLARLPKLFLLAGLLTVVAGAGLMLVAQRRKT